jgi:acetyl-CoA carboxylase alpha subunit
MALAMGDDVLAELRASGSILTPEDVAAWVVHLIEDDSRAGAVLQITSADGATFID